MTSSGNRALRPLAAVTLLFFLWSSFAPLTIAAWAQDGPARSRAAAPRIETAAEKFEAAVKATRDVVERIGRAVADGTDVTLDVDALEGHRQTIEALDAQVRAEFAQTEAKLHAANLPPAILQRHQQAVVDYDAHVSKLRQNLRAIEQLHREKKAAEARKNPVDAKAKHDALKQRVDDARGHLHDAVKERPHTPLDPNNLPYRTPQLNQRKPRLKPEEFTEFKKQIRLAFGGDLSTLLVAQATPDLPGPEDLAATPEVQFTQEIRDLATQLGRNPVQIYNWVRNNIQFVPTYGSIQGAHACLLSRQCNDTDTASLLIALLRASGIAARYVTGTIEVPVDQLMSWVGGFTDPRSALNFIASGGTPVAGVAGGGGISAAQLEHVWVEAFVDYVPSRGAVHRQGDTWIPLDASFKATRLVRPVDVGAAVGVDPVAALSELAATGTVGSNGDSITSISTLETAARLDSIASNLRTFVDTALPNATVGDVLGGVEIQAQAVAALAASLPETVVAVGSRFAEVPAAFRHGVTLQVLDRFGLEGIRLESSTVELAGKRVTIAYIPATEADVATLESFGGPLAVPPYLVHLRAVVYVDGQPAGSGPAALMGTTQTVKVSFTEPGGAPDAVEHVVTVGTYAALGLDLQRVSEAGLAARAARLATTRSQLGVVDVNWDDLMGEVLHVHAQTYFALVESFNRVAAHQLDVGAFKRPAEMLATFAPAFAYVFGSPVRVTNAGMNVDVRRYVVSASSRTGAHERERAYVFGAGVYASAAEHSVFQTMQGARSVSAIKLLSEANSRGIPIFTVHAGNAGLVLPQLNVSAAVLDDIRNAVATGKQVFVPRDNISFLEWSGVGYIVLDQKTGGAGYLISGGIAGGGTAESSDLLDKLKDALSALNTILDLLQTLAKIANFLAKAAAIGGVIGHVLNAISAIGTAIEIGMRTNSVLKGLAAGLIDLAFNYASSFLLVTAATAVVGVPIIGIPLAIAIVVGGAILASKLESIILDALFPPVSLLLRRRVYALQTDDDDPVSSLRPAMALAYGVV